MAKETRTINGSIRIGKRVYTEDGIFENGNPVEGDPHDELAALKPSEIERLSARGALAGFAKEPAKRASKAEAEPEVKK